MLQSSVLTETWLLEEIKYFSYKERVIKNDLFHYVYVCSMCVHLSEDVVHMYAGALHAKRGIRSSRAGGVDSWELPDMGLEICKEKNSKCS